MALRAVMVLAVLIGLSCTPSGGKDQGRNVAGSGNVGGGTVGSANRGTSNGGSAVSEAGKNFFEQSVKQGFRDSSSPRCLDCHTDPRLVADSGVLATKKDFRLRIHEKPTRWWRATKRQPSL